MIYEVKQVTTYSYTAPVPFARHVLRMTPLIWPGQRTIVSTLDIDPQPLERRDETDFFGNRITRIALGRAHTKLSLRMTARVAVDAPDNGNDLFAQRPWEEIRDAMATLPDLSPLSPAHFLYASRAVPLDAAIGAYAAASLTPGRTYFDAALDLARRIKADFTYQPGATDETTLPSTAFAIRRGVCQDFAHIMICGLRALGLPAAYVSGYLRTIPRPGRPRLEGADATHAWVSVWCGPELGWRGVDPTNGVAAGEDHILVAMGRDYADVAPVDGIVIAAGDHKLDVSVDVKEVG